VSTRFSFAVSRSETGFPAAGPGSGGAARAFGLEEDHRRRPAQADVLSRRRTLVLGALGPARPTVFGDDTSLARASGGREVVREARRRAHRGGA
jgi:hypothetical protein